MKYNQMGVVLHTNVTCQQLTFASNNDIYFFVQFEQL